VRSWRPEALTLLAQLGYEGQVYIPEDRTGGMHGDYTAQVDWETEGLKRADCIVFWVPRHMATMPALTTNDEWGFWKSSGKVVFGAPSDAVSVKYQRSYCSKHSIACFDTLEETLSGALRMVGHGATRRGSGECRVPLYIWRTLSFQNWYKALCSAGNVLRDVEVRFALPIKGNVFLWLLWVDVWITKEERSKCNELVLGRPDVASTVLLWRHPSSPWESKVVCVKEFRSAVSNPRDGYVVELPGGSDWNAPVSETVALEEVHEELGLQLPAGVLKRMGERQVAPTVLAHKVAAFVHEIDEPLLHYFVGLEGKAFGVVQDTERTFVTVRSVREMFSDDHVDWSTLGMVSKAVFHDQMRDDL
jgi:8-oxo-dGTP pyrophosphatase MutT (NUDIX family)